MAYPSYIDPITGVLTDSEAWVGVATTTLGSDTASVTFTSTADAQVGDWSQYMDLMVVIYVATTAAAYGDLMKTRVNSDTTDANYPYQHISGGGNGVVEGTSSGSGNRGIESRFCAGASSTNMFTAIIMEFYDVNSGKEKTVFTKTANDMNRAIQDANICITTSVWESPAPITSLTFSANGGSDDLAAGSKFSLFGVLPRMVA